MDRLSIAAFKGWVAGFRLARDDTAVRNIISIAV